jgi:hypothetical protein
MGTDHGHNLYPRFVTGNVEVSRQTSVHRPQSDQLARPEAGTTEA